MQGTTSATTAMTPEARADLFCQNLAKVVAVGKRADKWKRLALFIEEQLPQYDQSIPRHIERSSTGQFRSIAYLPDTKQVYIHLRKKDFADVPRHSFGRSSRAVDSEDDSRVKWREYHPALAYDLNAPRIGICTTTVSKPKVTPLLVVRYEDAVFKQVAGSQTAESKMEDVD